MIKDLETVVICSCFRKPLLCCKVQRATRIYFGFFLKESLQENSKTGIQVHSTTAYLPAAAGVAWIQHITESRAGDNRHKLKHKKFNMNVRKPFFHCESGWALAQAAERDCGVSILGNTQNSTGHDPGHLALAELAWERGFDKTVSRGTIHPQ